MAQLVERRVRNAKATSSNLVISTTDEKTNSDIKTEFAFFFSRDFSALDLSFNHNVYIRIIID